MAGKRKTATKIERHYIENNPEGKTLQELADELGLFKSVIEKIMLEKGEREVVEVEEVEETPAEETKRVNRMEGLIQNRTDGGKRGIAVLTSAASMRIDTVNENARSNARTKPLEGITKTYPDRQD